MMLNTELLGRSERQSMSDVDVGGAEFSGRNVLRQNLKGLGLRIRHMQRVNDHKIGRGCQ